MIQVEKKYSRIIKIKIAMGKKIGNIFSVYVPQVGSPEAEKDVFLGILNDVTTLAESEVLLVVCDLNDHIGEDRRSFEELWVYMDSV